MNMGIPFQPSAGHSSVAKFGHYTLLKRNLSNQNRIKTFYRLLAEQFAYAVGGDALGVGVSVGGTGVGVSVGGMGVKVAVGGSGV